MPIGRDWVRLSDTQIQVGGCLFHGMEDGELLFHLDRHMTRWRHNFFDGLTDRIVSISKTNGVQTRDQFGSMLASLGYSA